jgi:hypothetical protein
MKSRDKLTDFLHQIKVAIPEIMGVIVATID